MKHVIIAVFVVIAGASTAYSQRKYADPIAQPHKFPDPCDNPTVKRWGPMDQKGNFNYITPAKVLDALKLVRDGRLIRLDHLIEPGRNGVIGSVTLKTTRATRPGVPPFPPEAFLVLTFEQAMQPPVIPEGDFSLPFLATLDSAVNQQGAQMDAWNHMAAPGRNGRTYNCYNLLDDNNLYTVPDVQDPSGTMFAGFKGMGIDAIGSVITRGVLLDVFTSKKEQLVSQGADVSNFPPAGFFYTSEDLEDAMVRQGLRITDFEPGDVIFVRTGDAYKYWTEDPDKPRNDRPGFYNNQAQVDDRAGQWIVNRNAVAYASDTAGGPHHTLLPQGVTLVENLDLEMLSKDAHARYARSRDARRSYTFTTIFQPLRCRGCSGSTLAPVVVR